MYLLSVLAFVLSATSFALAVVVPPPAVTEIPKAAEIGRDISLKRNDACGVHVRQFLDEFWTLQVRIRAPDGWGNRIIGDNDEHHYFRLINGPVYVGAAALPGDMKLRIEKATKNVLNSDLTFTYGIDTWKQWNKRCKVGRWHRFKGNKDGQPRALGRDMDCSFICM